jgi:hypothetical protein
MRLNRGTIALLLGSVVIIAAVLIFTSSQVNAPTTEPTAEATPETGPLFAGLDMTTLNQLEIAQPSTGARTVLVKTTFSEASAIEVEAVATEEPVSTADATADATSDATSEVEPDGTEEAALTEEASATDEADIDITEETEETSEATEDVEATNEVTETEEATAEIEETVEVTTEVVTGPTFTLDPLITPSATFAPDAPVWVISEATTLSDMAVDFTQAENAVAVFSALQSVTSFTDAELSSFGLDAPRYTLTATDASGQTYRVDIGVKNPTQPRYYAIINGDTTTVYQIPADQVDSLTNLIANPPYLPTATPTLLPTATANPFSEVEQTATAAVLSTQLASTQAVQTLSVPLFTTPEATPEAP